MKLKIAILALPILLSGCVCVHEDSPTVRYYHRANGEYRHREVRPIRTDKHIGYQDDRGNIYLWPAK